MPVAARCWRLSAAAAQLTSRARHMSSTAPPPGGELPSLKAALRAIYKRVHPDLFQDCQPAKEANTRSFKMLHEYLEAARTGPRVPLPYRFHFFVRAEQADSSQGSAAGGGSATAAEAAGGAGAGQAGSLPAGLREVAVTLPPPTRGAPGEALSSSARKAFGTLLAALGLPSRIAGGGEGGGEADRFARFVSLREFLPGAVEAVHQHSAEHTGSQHRLAALRTALRLGRRVVATFAEPAVSAGPLQQLALLQRLVAALDALPAGADLAGLRVTIGQAEGVDALGCVWLSAHSSQAAWERHLASVDATHCLQLQALRQRVKEQEAAVAAALGLAMLYTQREASVGQEYRQALERLAAAAATVGPVGGGRFRGLPLMLQPGQVGSSGGDGEASSASSGGGGSPGRDGKVEGCAVDASAGLLLAPLGVSGAALYAAVERLGPQVLAAAAARRRREEELSALRIQVERKIMLRRLLRHPDVSDARYKSCLDRMLANAQKLSGLLHGQSVRVAEVNGLSPDKTVIDIAWNWQL